jgi:hypothetical protein
MTLKPVLMALLLGAASAAETPPAPEAAPPHGSAGAGRLLFIGARRLQNGGAPCGACHALRGEGPAFRASLGPELSESLAAMDPADLAGLLDTLPFPTMAPIYGSRPLTGAEAADLAAFLSPAERQGRPASERGFALGVGAVTALLFAGLALAARRRRVPSRARLLARAAARQGGTR